MYTVGEIIIYIKINTFIVQGNPIRVTADSVINRNPEKYVLYDRKRSRKLLQNKLN